MNKTKAHLQAIEDSLDRLLDGQGNGFAAEYNFGFETRTDPATYHWDGLKRGASKRHPYIVFQYTLEGWGIYADRAGAKKILPGMAFSAITPGDYRYYLPPESPRWIFFYIIFRHPYIVSRLVESQSHAGPVLTIPPTSVVVSMALKLIEGSARNTFRDDLDREQAVFEFLFAYQRLAMNSAYPMTERNALLEETKSAVLGRLHDAISTEERAAHHRMSRSHYSHHFKSRTGLSPARFITEIRLEEVNRRLLAGDSTLKEIAAETGFADANHLCKVFRRFHHISPGQFRRQMR